MQLREVDYKEKLKTLTDKQLRRRIYQYSAIELSPNSSEVSRAKAEILMDWCYQEKQRRG